MVDTAIMVDGFDLSIDSVDWVYNQSNDEILYTVKVKNLWNADYDIWWMWTIPQAHLILGINNNSNNPIWYLSALWQHQDTQTFYFNLQPVWANWTKLWAWTHKICNTFKVWLLNLITTSNIFPQDIAIANNTKEYCMEIKKWTTTTNLEDLAISSVTASWSYPNKILNITLTNLWNADYDIGWSPYNDPTVKLSCYQKWFKQFWVSKLITDYIWSSQPSISTTLNLKLRWWIRSKKDIICKIDSTDLLTEINEINNTYVFRI
jgi:hypothetical protein